MLSTAVRNAISNITYPIRHEFARTTPDLRGVDADLDQYGEANAHILVTGLASREFSSHNRDFDYGVLVGRIMPVRPSRPEGEQWYLSADDNGGNGAYLTGARVSQTPVNGRVYQELRDMEGAAHASPFLLRYNDEAHREDRAQPNNPWTIVWAQDGLEHQVGHGRVTPPTAWVEVRWPLSPVTTGLATDEDIDLILSDEVGVESIVIVPTLTGMGNTVEGHTLGKAVVETEGEHAGAVIVDPVRVPGDLYLTWFAGRDYYDDHVFVQVALDGDVLTPVGYFNRGTDGRVYYNDDPYSTPPVSRFGSNADMHWAKLALEVPEVAPDADARRTAIIEEATVAHEAFEDLNDALNDLARYQSWCSEYERTMQFIGMRDRRNGTRGPFDVDNVGAIGNTERHAWDVQYDVEVTITDDSLSYRVSNMLESEYGASSVSDLRFDATISVTINGIVAEDEDAAENMVSRSQIEDELDNMLEGEFEINDYSHSDTTEDTDFDWDEYDDNN